MYHYIVSRNLIILILAEYILQYLWLNVNSPQERIGRRGECRPCFFLSFPAALHLSVNENEVGHAQTREILKAEGQVA